MTWIVVRDRLYLVRGGHWTRAQLVEQYDRFVTKYRSDLSFIRWLVERGKVYSSVKKWPTAMPRLADTVQKEKNVKAKRTCADCGNLVKPLMTMARDVAAVGAVKGTNLCPTCIARRKVKR